MLPHILTPSQDEEENVLPVGVFIVQDQDAPQVPALKQRHKLKVIIIIMIIIIITIIIIIIIIYDFFILDFIMTAVRCFIDKF